MQGAGGDDVDLPTQPVHQIQPEARQVQEALEWVEIRMPPATPRAASDGFRSGPARRNESLLEETGPSEAE